MPADPAEPVNVRVTINGVEYACDLLRDPGLDRAGCTGWAVVPAVSFPPIMMGRDSVTVHADYLPANTLLSFRAPLPGEIP